MNHDHEHDLSTTRIETFSDAVIAIIVTLLVLDLKVPELVATVGNAGVIKALLNLAPQFASFVISFFVICIFWVNHHQFFHGIRRADRKLLWLNNLLLFWLCFIPFPTALLGRYPTNTVAVMLYGAILFLAAATFSTMSYYAFFKGKLVDEHLSQKELRHTQRRSYVGISAYGLSVLAAPLSISISLAIFLIVPLIYFVPRRLVYGQE
jgi:uncharacterized membrane protein